MRSFLAQLFRESRPLLLACGVGACGLAASVGCAERPHSAQVPEGGLSLGAPSVPWSHKTREERMGYMAAAVHPRMKQVFVESDESYAESFSCETCHGSEMELVDYRMPSEALYALPADNPVGEAMDLDEDVANFMMGKVMPAMAELLSAKPGAKGGVNCFTCHPPE